MDKPYSKREVDVLFLGARNQEKAEHQAFTIALRDIGDQVKEGFDGVHKRQDTTNGRVRWTEKMLYLAIGFCCCVSVMILPLIWALITSGKI